MTVKVFDRNGDGLISGEELKLTMCSLGETLTEDEVCSNYHLGIMFDPRYCPNIHLYNQNLCFKEFVNFWKRICA